MHDTYVQRACESLHILSNMNGKHGKRHFKSNTPLFSTVENNQFDVNVKGFFCVAIRWIFTQHIHRYENGCI